MESKGKKPIVVSIAGMPKRKQKKVVKRMTEEVIKDKEFRKTLRRSEEKIPKEVAHAAARAAVQATLGTKTGNPVVPPKKTGLEVYTELVGKFAEARRVRKRKQKHALKAAKKEGYNPKTGFYDLKKADKIKKAKKVKRYKPKKAKK